jgi:Cys-rich protein (TIGR01571 family)
MASTKTFFLLFTMVTYAYGAFMGGQIHRQESLSSEAADLRVKGYQAHVDEPRKLISFFRGMVSQEPKEEKDELYEISDFKEFAIMNGAEIVVSFLIWLLLYLGVAAYYTKNVLPYEPPAAKEADDESKFRTFRSGLFSCTEDTHICFWAFCCTGIRWADTRSKLGIRRFWPAFLIITGLMCLSWIPVCTVLCHIIVCCWFTHSRQEFREHFNFEEQGSSVCVKDCCTYFWCPCCAVAQEGRHVQDACTHNHPAIRRSEGAKDS